ncbi:hypothetical protein [Cohnella rhizosphaerae]|uniref:PDZ domain-containing protein n=1 Tax=Cohnella rhizosphaerae TaxID=1457232 RepID=A0A9X4KX14_9BACL|nr:hypothetical protein [Cohnella rhizosphaerae]MDG0812869.1 hypothetical protein [Cohnella rhizosphaerae]
MSNKKMYPILYLVLLAVLIWFISVIEKYPYIDIEVAYSNGKWYVTGIDPKSQAFKTSLKVGTEILSIDGKEVLSNRSVQKWRTINKAKFIEIFQDNKIQTINFENYPKLTKADTASLIEGLFSFLLSFLLISNVRKSLSARYLSFVFISISLTFF